MIARATATSASRFGKISQHESTMVRQITTANAFDSITISDLISVNCCDYDRLTVTNTGAVPVVISTNPLLYIKRVS